MQKIKTKYTEYARKVINNEIVACELIKLACKRYMSFFERDDVYFDSKAVDKVVNFIGKLRHTTDISYNRPFILSDWQFWMICAIYGFKWKKDDTRVTRTVYVEIGRKNGKSSLMSALALYHLVADGVHNAQVSLQPIQPNRRDCVLKCLITIVVLLIEKADSLNVTEIPSNFRQLKADLRLFRRMQNVLMVLMPHSLYVTSCMKHQTAKYGTFLNPHKVCVNNRLQ